MNGNCAENRRLVFTSAAVILGGIVISLMEYGFIDMIIATGANLYHDMHFALDLPVHQGEHHVDDVALFKAGIERIYDIFITEELLLKTVLLPVSSILQNAPKLLILMQFMTRYMKWQKTKQDMAKRSKAC